MRYQTFPLLGVALLAAAAVVGCGKKTPPTTADTTPPAVAPRPAGGTPPGSEEKKPGRRPPPPAEKLGYDPAKAEVRIDLPKTGSRAENYPGAAGKVATVRGRMNPPYVRTWEHDEPGVRRVNFSVSGEFGFLVNCTPRTRIDWRQAATGRTVTVVGIMDFTDPLKQTIRLKDATVTVSEGPSPPEVTAEELGKEYAAGAAAFEKARKGKAVFVTGTVKEVKETTLTRTAHAYRLVLAGGAADLTCFVDNERDVDTDQVAAGDRVTVMGAFYQYGSAAQDGFAITAVYAGKAR